MAGVKTMVVAVAFVLVVVGLIIGLAYKTY